MPGDDHTINPESAKAVDARFKVHVGGNRMKVDLELLNPASGGGRELSLEWLKDELAQRKIVFGFDDEKLQAALAKVAAGPAAGPVRLADGRPARAGENGRLELLVGPKAATADPVAAAMVRPDQVLIRKIAPRPGEAGRDVFGEELPPPSGYDPPLQAGVNARLSEDKLSCLAEVYGRVTVVGDLVNVENLVEIAPDGMSAWLPVHPRLADDTPLEYEHLAQALAASGVVHGIFEEEIRAVLEQGVEVPRLLAAKGEPSEDGVDAAIRFLFTLNNEDPLRVAQMRRDGRLNPAAIRKSLCQAGELLAEKTPARPARAGRRVTGEEIAGREPRDSPLSAGANVSTDLEGLVFKVADDLVAGYADYDDGVLTVSDPLQVDQDEMTAVMEIHPPDAAGRGLNGELFLKILAAHQISHGVRKKAIRQAVELVAAKDRVLQRVVVARGREPVNGRDAHIELLVKPEKGAGRIVHEGTERMDFRERDAIWSVKKGDVLAHRTPPEEGVDGYTVRGRPLTAKAGSDLQFQPQPNVVISDDGLYLLSDIDGMIIVLAPNKIAVFEVYEVKGDVDYKVGNLDMAGTLIIGGWVRPGFTLKASGDIRVAGGVEDATLLAGANVEVAAGVISRGRGRIKAGKDVSARFLEWTRVHAGGSIVVHDQIMRSQVFACRTLTATAGRGRIRGGVVSAIQGIEANEIGSPAGVRTVVMAGANPGLRRRLLQVDKQLAGFARQRAKMDTVLGRWLNHHRGGKKLPGDAQRKLSLLAKQRRALVQAENRLARPRQLMLRELAAIDLNAIRIVAHKAVFAGTVVVIGRAKHKVREDLPRAVTFRYNEDGRDIKVQ